MHDTMRDARQAYFEENGFGDDGGYGDAWVDFKLGPLPFPFPNSAERVRAVRYHDLHHVLTGYATDFRGEMEISAWEIGAGCEDFWVAWQLNLAGMVGGTLTCPRRTWRAWLRGRRSQSLYGEPLEAILDRTVADARAHTKIPAGVPRARLGDRAWFALALLAGTVSAALSLAIFVPLLPFAFVSLNLGRARDASA